MFCRERQTRPLDKKPGRTSTPRGLGLEETSLGKNRVTQWVARFSFSRGARGNGPVFEMGEAGFLELDQRGAVTHEAALERPIQRLTLRRRHPRILLRCERAIELARDRGWRRSIVRPCAFAPRHDHARTRRPACCGTRCLAQSALLCHARPLSVRHSPAPAFPASPAGVACIRDSSAAGTSCQRT